MGIIEKKHPDTIRNAYDRIKDFDEVSLGYDNKTAVEESKRCLNCKNKPCVASCPVGIDIPGFIKLISENQFKEAYELISKYSCFPAICGRVCPQESQCEKTCTLGINNDPVSIGKLERFVADYYINNFDTKILPVSKNNKKIAIIGSGPSGLSCAGELIKNGYNVTIYEALHETGGVLRYGIPSFRLPKNIVDFEIDKLILQGVEISKNVVIGKSISIDELKKDFDAIFIGTGAGLPMFMNIKGEEYNGVYSANET